jgi:hypothetical protein
MHTIYLPAIIVPGRISMWPEFILKCVNHTRDGSARALHCLPSEHYNKNSSQLSVLEYNDVIREISIRVIVGETTTK